jgi:hypothetical protein
MITATAYLGDWGISVMVYDPGERTLARYQLPGSGDFEVQYVHSYYEAPASEHFVAEKDSSFELVEVSSPSEAVLDYYELEGRKEAEEGLLRLVPDEPQRFEELSVIGTEKGRRTLIVSDERFPLYEKDRPRHVTLRVEGTIFTESRGLLGG